MVNRLSGLSTWARSPKGRRVLRWLMAGPGAVIATLAVTAGMPFWVPPGEAGVDHLILPLILMPLLWGALFFYACLDRSVMRVALTILALCLVNGVAVFQHAADTEGPAMSGAAR